MKTENTNMISELIEKEAQAIADMPYDSKESDVLFYIRASGSEDDPKYHKDMALSGDINLVFECLTSYMMKDNRFKQVFLEYAEMITSEDYWELARLFNLGDN